MTQSPVDAALKRCPQCDRTYPVTEQFCGQDGSPLALEQAEDPLIGLTILDRFRIERAIGAGGMGTVYRGIQLSVGRPVALKVLHPQLAAERTAVERFLVEAKAVSRLKSKHTITLFDFGQTGDGLLFMAMELLEGTTLQGRLAARGCLGAAETVAITRQIASSLAEAHEQGILHRDLKPGNVFLTTDAEGQELVKVLDFGIARAASLTGETRLTRTGTICGTPQYMAPETVVAGEQDARVDVYALGVMMYQMLCGALPFDGDTPVEVMMAHLSVEPALLHERNPDAAVPFPVTELVWRCLSKRRDRRPAGGRALRDELDALPAEPLAEPAPSVVHDGLETSNQFTFDAAALPTALVRQPAPPDPPAPAVTLGASPPMPSRRPGVRDRSRWALAGLVAAALALGGVAWVVSADAPSPPPAETASDTDEAVAAPPVAEPPAPEGAKEEPGTADEPQPETPAVAEPAKPDVPAPEPAAEETQVAAPPAQNVAVTVLTRPGGAVVTYGGERLGKAPQILRVPTGSEPVSVKCSKSGYRTGRVTFKPDRDQVVTCRAAKVRPSEHLPP